MRLLSVSAITISSSGPSAKPWGWLNAPGEQPDPPVCDTTIKPSVNWPLDKAVFRDGGT